ncbi:F-box/FBD/LRR-repeat protein [Panicum miliaceum]|uniref:F-box/FBD/LRR-repeat protein n=1 Tax=Panicum miliaceum TaxID=4540 RepID=A0A3L6SLY8_PANMI|nr:F-box/FBD/LRR-repeat protein [Panicum miliaceum]
MYLRGASKGVCLKIAHAPKLKFLGYLSMNLHKIEIRETIFRDHQIIVKTLMPSLKTLAIEVSYTYEGFQAAASESWDVLRHIPCVHNHLEKVVFEVYRGHEWQREMAKFLHGRSRVLKAMEFHCMRESDGGATDHKKPSSVEWVREQQELLCLDSRASKGARFLFFKGQLPCNHWDICHHEWYKRKTWENVDMVFKTISEAMLSATTRCKQKVDYDRYGCLTKYNALSRYHNDLLCSQVKALRKEYPYAKITFVDYYNPVLTFLHRPAIFDEIDHIASLSAALDWLIE